MTQQQILYKLKIEEMTFRMSHEQKAMQQTARPQRV